MGRLTSTRPPHTTPGAAGGDPRRRRADRLGYASTRPRPAPDAPGPDQPRPPPAPSRGRCAASDHGVVLTHGDGPGGCDVYGARDVVVWPVDGTLYMHYDGCGAGRLAAVPGDEHGRALLDQARPGAGARAAREPRLRERLVRDAVPPRRHVASVLRRHAERHPAAGAGARGAVLHAEGGGVRARRAVDQAPGHRAVLAAAGDVLRGDRESGARSSSTTAQFLQFFSASAGEPLQRTLGIARTTDLDGAWTIDPAPILPATEQIENAALYHEPANDTWFLFTNHVDAATSTTDAVWVYWTTDLDGMGSGAPRGGARHDDVDVGEGRDRPARNRQPRRTSGALLRRRAGAGRGHTGRDIGLAWLPLPLTPPQA